MRRTWEIRPRSAPAEDLLSRELKISPLLARLLVGRGMGEPEQARRFLSPSLSQLNDPFRLADMERAVDRLLAAWQRGERVAVCGDYDADGVCSVALLKLFWQALGEQLLYHIPSRLQEGYGLNLKALRQFAESGVHLVLAVDCGISDIETIRAAKELGLETIVVDHHQVSDRLPEAVAVLDPQRPDCGLHGEEPAAVGVVFYLLMALRSRLRQRGAFRERPEPNLRELLDLVALGSIADMVPLTGDNRTLVAFGLEELRAAKRAGLAALKEVAGLTEGPLSAGQVAFRLAPRVNAIGRLGQAHQAVELLTTASYAEALRLARVLDQANQERQRLEQQTLEQALQLAGPAGERNDPALVLWNEDWHPGVIGIVASRLSEHFGRPTVLVALAGAEGKGSARAAGGIHLYQALAACAEELVGFGGHRAAAGLKIRRERLESFRRAFLAEVAKQLATGAREQPMLIDAEVPLSYWTPAGVAELSSLAPFGMGNPEPLFMANGISVTSARVVGNGAVQHLKLILSETGHGYEAIGFEMADRLGLVHPHMDFVYHPYIDTWAGPPQVRFRLQDFRRSEGAP